MNRIERALRARSKDPGQPEFWSMLCEVYLGLYNLGHNVPPDAPEGTITRCVQAVVDVRSTQPALPVEFVLFGTPICTFEVRALEHPVDMIRSRIFCERHFETASKTAEAWIRKMRFQSLAPQHVTDLARKVVEQFAQRIASTKISIRAYPRYLRRIAITVQREELGAMDSSIEPCLPVDAQKSLSLEPLLLIDNPSKLFVFALDILHDSVRTATNGYRDRRILITLGRLTQEERNTGIATTKLATRYSTTAGNIRLIFMRSRRRVLRAYLKAIKALPQEQQRALKSILRHSDM